MEDLPATEAMIAVLEAGRTGSMAAAADRLGVTHGAVSRRIQAVERWLGAPVFERRGRGVHLTAQGSQFVRRAERALGSIETLRSELSTARTQAVRMSTLPSVARLWLLPRLGALETELPPGRVIDVVTDHRLARLDAREADVAIRLGYGGWPGTRAEPLFGDRVLPVASPALAARLRGRPAAALMSETLIHESDGADWRRWARNAGVGFAPLGAERRFLDHDLALDAAAAGLGVALARLPLAQARLATGGLVALPYPGYVSERSHFVVVRDGESRRGVLAVMEALLRLGADETAVAL